MNALSFPLSGSEPGKKGVGTQGCGHLKVKAAKHSHRISLSLPPPRPASNPQMAPGAEVGARLG